MDMDMENWGMGALAHLEEGACRLDACAWNKHPNFEGVELKHLVRGEATKGALSCHLVRVAPGKCLQSHTHDPQWELHEVVAGDGCAKVGERNVEYTPGTMAVIKSGAVHEVTAGDKGLVLFAKFFPALL